MALLPGRTGMFRDYVCTGANQIKGYSEQISHYPKSGLIAGVSEGLLFCLLSLPLSPGMG